MRFDYNSYYITNIIIIIIISSSSSIIIIIVIFIIIIIIIIIVIILNDLKNYVNGWTFYCIPLRMWIILLIRALHCVDQLYFSS